MVYIACLRFICLICVIKGPALLISNEEKERRKKKQINPSTNWEGKRACQNWMKNIKGCNTETNLKCCIGPKKNNDETNNSYSTRKKKKNRMEWGTVLMAPKCTQHFQWNWKGKEREWNGGALRDGVICDSCGESSLSALKVGTSLFSLHSTQFFFSIFSYFSFNFVFLLLFEFTRMLNQAHD